MRSGPDNVRDGTLRQESGRGPVSRGSGPVQVRLEILGADFQGKSPCEPEMQDKGMFTAMKPPLHEASRAVNYHMGTLLVIRDWTIFELLCKLESTY
jgi:hypothetical protein